MTAGITVLLRCADVTSCSASNGAGELGDVQTNVLQGGAVV